MAFSLLKLSILLLGESLETVWVPYLIVELNLW